MMNELKLKSRRDDIDNTIPSGLIFKTGLFNYNPNTPLVLNMLMKDIVKPIKPSI
jgi:hypothetical protein